MSEDLKDAVIREEADGSAVVDIPGTKNEIDEDEKPTTHREEDEHSEEDELAAASTEDEREKIRERRRQERQNRKVYRKEKEDSLRRQLDSERQARLAVEERLNVIERKSTGSEMAQIDQAIKQSVDSYTYYKEQLGLAAQAGKGDIVADATEKMMTARNQAEHLTRIKQSLTTQQSQPRALDPRLVSNAQAWMNDNKWYNPAGTDDDSRILLALDDKLAQENWNPNSIEYWEELSTRAKKYLPHRFAGDKSKPRSVVTGSERESSTVGSTGFKLSADRVKAMKDAGAWENAEKRAKMIANYRDYDRRNGAR